MASQIRAVDHEEMDLSAALCVVGFPGVGLVGRIATDFLVSQFELKRIASFRSDDFPPMAVLVGGQTMSPVRIHAAPMVCGVDGMCDQLAVLQAEITPAGDVLYELAEALISWCLEKKVREMVVLEGFVRPEGTKDAVVFGAGNNAETLGRMDKIGVKPLGEGVISGIAGPLSYLAEDRGLNVTVLLAETSREFPDARASAKLLEIIDPIVPHIDIDAEPLYERAELIETRLKENMEQHQESVEGLTDRAKIMYG
ncbi:MAG: proteasome assembly chaperone family protein [Thermoplasmata archaeon]